MTDDSDSPVFEPVPPCAVCGHPPEMHDGASGCTWSQNPLSQSASIFCKCREYR